MHCLSYKTTTSIAPLSVLILCSTIIACGFSDPLEAIRRAQAEGRIEETIEPLRALLKERPGDAEVLFIYGLALSNTGKSGLAEWSLREAMKDPDWTVTAGLRLAADAARSRNFESAIAVSSQILELESDNIDALLIRSSAYTHSRMYHAEALEDAKRVLELDPDNLLVLEAKILALIGLERIDELTEAIEELGRRIDEGDSHSGATAWHCATTALFAWESDDIELANSRWDLCLEMHPSDPEVVWKVLPYYDSEARYNRSVEVLVAALAERPAARSYRVNLAARYMNAGELEKAEEVLLAGTEIDNPALSSAGWLDLAKYYQEVERYEEAADAVGRGVGIVEEVAEPQPALLFEYADSLLIAGQFEDALEVVERMNYAPYREMIKARIAQERRDFPLALKHFKAAFQLWPDNPWARYYAAIVSEAVGDFDGAVEQYRYSIRISPGATDSRIRVARLHLAEGRPGHAVQILRTKANEASLGPEGDLLSLELWARAGRGGEIRVLLEKIRTGSPHLIGQALARTTLGLNGVAGPKVAVMSLRKSGQIDFADLNYSDAIRALIEYSVAGELDDDASGDLATALAANPKAASLLEILAFQLELTGAPADAIRSAYNDVLAIEPENARGLAGLARQAAKLDNAESSLSYFDRAAAADPDEESHVIEACRALIALGRRDEAEERLNKLLDRVQYEGAAAALLVGLHLDRALSADRTLDLAKRAVRFGGGIEGLNLLARVYVARHEPDLAKRATDRVTEILKKRAG
jgi:tetratricopeptide (TPR) repeat protein